MSVQQRSGGWIRRVLAAVLLLAFLPAGTSRADTEPPLYETQDDGSGNVTRQVNFFDRVDLVDGQVLLIAPIWSEEQELPRPPSTGKFTVLKYVAWNKADKPGRIGIDAFRIARIKLWEQYAVDALLLALKEGRVEDCRFLLTEIQRFNPKWDPSGLKKIGHRVRLAEALQQAKDGPAAPGFEQALATLDELQRTAPDTPELIAAFEKTCLPVAEEYYKAQRYVESRDLLARVLTADAKSVEGLRLKNRIQKDAETLMASAESSLKQGQGYQAAQQALQSLIVQPQDAELQRRAREILKVYQILRVACYESPSALDPFQARQFLEKQCLPLLFDRLVEPDETGLRFFNGPLVKESRPVPGFRRLPGGGHAIEYEFELHPDLMYSNGALITAADVAGTVRALQNPAAAGHDPELARLLLDVVVKDPFRFSLLTRQHPYPESLFTIPVVPETSTIRLPKSGDPLSRQPIGSGPYQATATTSLDEPLRLEANRRFRAGETGQPWIREIVFQRYQKKGEGHAEEDLLKRRIHMISDPSPMQLVRLQNASQEFQTRPMLSNSVWVLAINHRHPLLKERDVRRAMVMAIDREAILKQWFAGGAGSSLGHSVVTGPFPPQSSASDPSITVVPPQPAVARRLLSGVLPNGQAPPLTLKYPQTDLTIELAVNQIRRDLEAAGFTIRLDPKLPNDLLHEVATQHSFDLAYWRIDHQNILFNIGSLFDPSPQALQPGGANFFGYAPQKLTQLLVDLRNEQVGERIWQIQHRIHRLMADEVVMVPLWRLDSFVVYTKRLGGRTPDGKRVDLPVDRTTVFRRTEDWFLEPPE